MDGILHEQRDGVATLVLNRPHKLNALAGTMREELLAALQAVSGNAEEGAVIVTGAGRGFCAGGDLKALAELLAREDRPGVARLLELGAQIVLAIRAMPKPVIAAVNGVAAGAGLSLALACDLRLAARSASFVQSFLKVGLHPDWGGSLLLPRLVGPARACEMTWRAEPVDADTALQYGLVNRVVADDRLADEARQWAELLRRRSPAALALTKPSFYPDTDLAAALAAEREAQLQCMFSPQARAEIAAFLRRAR